MNTKTIIFSLLFLFGLATAQEKIQSNFIEVEGTAEMMIEPDEVNFEIVLQTNDKVSLQDAEKKFFEILKKNNIDSEEVNFKSSGNNYWYYWWNNRNTFRKVFQIKINPKTQVLSFLEDLNQKWVSSVNLTNKNNSKMADYRKEVKIQAIKAAKEKANYLLNAIGNKAGKPLEIIEISDNDSDEVVNMGYNKAKFSNYVSKSELTNNQIDNVESIKLRYTIKAKFEIQ